ncbi:MAG: HD-GYP domain-containing protein [Desulfobulbales bacterium]|nr:HD-GYP domain-containing protein [Desulfobulbales bacterium]
MDSLSFLIIGAIIAGTLFISAALFLHLRAGRRIPEQLQSRWRLMACLMAFFLTGYLFFLFIYLSASAFPLAIITATVFFFGGFFVFLVTGITLSALRRIVAHERQLRIINEALQRSNFELIKAYDTTIAGWGYALELRDQETRGHTRRVAGITRDIARQFGLRGDQLVHITRGAQLHDIGKMAVPDSVLMKEGPLTEEERRLIQHHPLAAYEMLSKIEYLKPALDIPYCHHERWDGTGYPRGLKGTEIPLAARIFAVADTWDALAHDRRYHKAWPLEKVCAHIESRAGSHFDPEVVTRFLKMDYCRAQSATETIDSRP